MQLNRKQGTIAALFVSENTFNEYIYIFPVGKVNMCGNLFGQLNNTNFKADSTLSKVHCSHVTAKLD